MPDPIPIELATSGRELTEPRLDPEGNRVAFVDRRAGGASIAIVATAGGPERIVTTAPAPAPGRGLGGGCFDWLPDGSGVVYAAADGELWLQRFDSGPRRLTSWERSCRAPCVAPDASFVACVVDEAEVWQIDLADGATRRLDDGGDGFCFDPAVVASSARVVWQAWSAPSMPWDDACAVTYDRTTGAIDRWRPDSGAVQQPRFLPDGTAVCVHDGSGWANVVVGGEAPVPERFEHAGPSWGMGQRSFAPSPDGTQIAFTRNESGFGRLCVAPIGGGEATDVGRGVHGQLSWAGDSLVALRTGARTPTQIVRYSVPAFERTVLAVGPAVQWDAVDLPEPEPFEVDHDGVTLHARRYPASEGRMLCWVHGGPTDQWQVDFRPRIAYWWSRGWDVLVVDPRGTTGHGRAYQRALNGAWGRLDVDDTAAIVAAAHRAGWAQPATTIVIGGSSGGLTVLGMLADHGGLVAGGVASYPVSDLMALTEATHRFEAHYTESLVGPVADEARYAELSPIHRADHISVPLLVFHGSDDPVVPIAQSEALVARIRAAPRAHVEYIVYEGEGHGFRDPANQRDEYERTEAFVSTLLPDR
ncbi:MAG: S9 family peptidase [Ilumatobacteraceae bacterium]